MKPQIERALGQYLSVRERSAEEVARYLKRKLVDASEIEKLVERWKEVGILNDTSFVASVVRSYLNKGKGTLFIRRKLQQAGIGREETNKALGSISKHDLAAAMEKRLSRVESRLGSLSPSLARQKMIKALLASGFLLEESVHFIDDWLTKE